MKNQFEIVDFHSHILPSADHGSSSVETSLFQLNSAVDAGVTRIIATPHFYPHVHTVDAFLERREAAYKSLMPRIPNGVEIRLAAEVLICPGIHNLPGLEKLFIHGTNTLLLEISNTDFGPEHVDTVRELIGKGIDVVLAHADRYNPSCIEQLIELGAKIQLNACSLNTIFRSKHLYDWLNRGLVVGIGSDIHGADKRAYPALVKAYGKISKYSSSVSAESNKIWNNSKKY